MVRVNQLGVNEIVCNLSQNINVLRFSDQWQVNYVSIKRCQYWANHHNFKLHSWDKHTYTLCEGIVVQQVVSWGNFEIYKKWKRLGSSKTHMGCKVWKCVWNIWGKRCVRFVEHTLVFLIPATRSVKNSSPCVSSFFFYHHSTLLSQSGTQNNYLPFKRSLSLL